MTTLEFLIAFSIAPVGGLLIAALLLYITRRDRAKADNPRPR